MQMVTNCVLRQGNRLLMLKKPRRGWWVAPGGKVDPYESLLEAVTREFYEETGLQLHHPELRGVFTIVQENDTEAVNHWMLYTFYAEECSGSLLSHSEEGQLEWVPIDSLQTRPMAEGDRIFLQHILQEKTMIMGKFTYTEEYELLQWKREDQRSQAMI